MSITRQFITRPIATALLAMGILLCGIVAYTQLPIAPLPKMDFPSINVSARLPGASPETMAATVAAPLERRLGQIPGISELTSVSGQGSSSITALFDLNRDIDGAARDVQAAINAAASDLPSDLPSLPTYRKMNPSEAPILILAVTSDQLAASALYDATDAILAQQISQIDGVGQVQVSGADKPAVRIQVDPVALAASGTSLEQLRSSISAANSSMPTGILHCGEQSVSLATPFKPMRAADYQSLIVATGKHSILRLSDIATVSDSVENIRQAGWYNLDKSILLIIQKSPNANVIETVDHIKTILPQLEAWMPAGTHLRVLMDRTQTIRASVAEVERALLISSILVVLVVWFSLGRVTPTLAASITIPLALAATFAVMHLLGFSLNTLSLMALTVCVGFVIDNAIVMIENIAHHLERGESPIMAAIHGAKEMSFTIVSISISLVAVFIPILFMGGIIGRMFQEFAITLTVAILASLVICLTVTPTLYAAILRWRHPDPSPPPITRPHLGERWFNALQTRYEHGLGWVLRHQGFMLLVVVATIGCSIWLYITIPKGFFPQQDTGMLIATSEAGSDISFDALIEKQQLATRIILNDPAVDGMASSVGSGGGPSASSNQGRMFIALKPLAQRDASADAIIARLRPKLATIPGLSVFMQAAQDLRAGGRNSKAQFQFVLSAESLSELREWMPILIAALKQEPGITDVNSDQDAASGQLKLVIDRDRAARLGVTMEAVDQTLQNSFTQRQISTMYQSRNQYHVVLELLPRYTQDASTLEHLFVPARSGALIPLSSIAHTEISTAPLSVQHQGQFPAATLSFNLSKGAALGDATTRIERVATAIHLPPSIHYGFAGNAAAFAASMRDEPILILSAFLAIYLVLGILYENTLHPLTILSTLPSAGLGALLALKIGHYDLSIIAIIGVILLMGIVKKNGIILIDCALQHEREGMHAIDAMREACKRRFRPILMTSLAATMGALPLIFGGSNGAELRQPLGVTIVGGLVASQLLTIYTTPVVFLCLERARQRFRAWWGIRYPSRCACSPSCLCLARRCSDSG